MKTTRYLVCLLFSVLDIAGCDGVSLSVETEGVGDHAEYGEVEPLRGPHGGRLLVDGEFAIELSIFETGLPPVFRVWATKASLPIAPSKVELHITLTRFGERKDEINFAAQEDFLLGDSVIYEPHSFVVSIDARHGGVNHRWQYDNFEGRTRISLDVTSSFGLETDVAGPAKIIDVVTAYGRVEPDQERHSSVSARFDGVIKSVRVSLGDRIKRGQTLATVESNESLKSYALVAPISGTVTERIANVGEQTQGRALFVIIDTRFVWVQLALFPSVRNRVQTGAPVTIGGADGDAIRTGVISRFNTIAEPNQAVMALVVLDNADGALVPGMYVTGDIQVAEYDVPLAVKRSGLQPFRDFTVVYRQIDDEYEVRMLELGRQDSEWVEVLGGIELGARYVTTNSYLIKADIEKSGASHNH